MSGATESTLWRLWRRIRTEARDLIELILLPALAAVLPWPVVYRIFRRLAGCDWLYRVNSNVALRQAEARAWAPDAAHFSRIRRVVALVDHADHYLAATRGKRWMDKYIDVTGHWPLPQQASLLLTFHWGAGMWGLRHAQASGLRPHALVASLEADAFNARTVLRTYARARTAQVSRTLGAPTVDTSASLRPVLKALKRHAPVLAAVDVPADQVAASQSVELAGSSANMPRGLFRLAVEEKIPVTVYLTGIRLDTGRRTLDIHNLGVVSDVDTLMQMVFSYLDDAIRKEPAAWHFWSEADRIFRDSV